MVSKTLSKEEKIELEERTFNKDWKGKGPWEKLVLALKEELINVTELVENFSKL